MQKQMLELALKARLNAHAPYSNFLVGSVVLDENDNLHQGANIENAAYPSGSCAEEQAIGTMHVSGGRKIKELIVIGKSKELVVPCGACRQRIREFSDENTKIHIYDVDRGFQKTFSLEELLPHSFGPENL